MKNQRRQNSLSFENNFIKNFPLNDTKNFLYQMLIRALSIILNLFNEYSKFCNSISKFNGRLTSASDSHAILYSSKWKDSHLTVLK